MKILIKNGRLLDPSNNRDEITDLLICGGIIAETGKNISSSADEVIDASGMWVAPGLIDIHVHFREPGYEYKETILTGAQSAAKGGFTTVCCMPNTNPVNDNIEITEYIKHKAESSGLVNVLPVGSITKGQAGTELSDIGGMVAAGICAISEDGKTVINSGLMKKALIVAKQHGLPVFSHCEDIDLDANDNESEELIVARDIILAGGVGTKLHICHVSTKGSIELLRFASQRGFCVTAEAAPHHFTLSKEDIKNPNYKMNPPLRRKNDVQAIKEAIRDNIIQVIATDHAPHHADEKNCSYEKAANGIIGLETAIGLTIIELVDKGYITPLQMIEKMSTNPARILGIDRGSLAEGHSADITIIDPLAEYNFDVDKFASKAKNSPFHGFRAKGKPVYTIVNGKIIMRMGVLL